MLLLVLMVQLAVGADYFVDCASGNDDASGIEAEAAWRSLDRVNRTEFRPGDRVLFKRGATCSGQLWPKGSGGPGQPITIGAYGAGKLPVINGSGQRAAVRLFNQHHWVIRNIEATGSSEYGIHISGDKGTLRHIRLIDSVVHDVKSSEAIKTKLSGLVVVEAGANQTFEDVVIDGVTAYETNRWAGIVVSGAMQRHRDGTSRSRNVRIRNSIVHHVYGDGIILFALRDGVIERSAAWYTGLVPSHSIGTPNGIWTWSCDNCIVRETEGFFTDSSGVDGGVYDIDWGNHRNVVEDNYGHDAQAYCIAVFGAGGLTTTDSEVRGNVCVGNGRSARLARHHGEVQVKTWGKGFIDGLRIHSNLFLWEPPIRAQLLRVESEFSGTRPNVFENNRIATNEATGLESSGSLKVNGNQHIPRADALRLAVALPSPPELAASGFDLQSLRGSPFLLSFLPRELEASRSQAVVMESAAVQYQRKGLQTIILSDEAPGLAIDWNLQWARAESGRMPKATLPLTLLFDRAGQLLYRWEGYAPAKEVVFAVRKMLGPPD